ncbi:glycosyl hydrolase family 18 protein [Neobacillus ginsengisoli]|uniref:chitinase n=1 Tax=Neobacillus ginsengisoli TaxID=904295 RepID=A0ABT9Y0J9_9BACI|nr:glycoside hydrolase family 18 protein [Neobacillus ginsengisoli]MDQ0201347.1 GH18 family chitinase [Neobacillus ginsengisoli]
MNKRNLLLGLVIATTFIGGFFSGVLFTTNNGQQDRSKTIKIKQQPSSAIKPKQKAIPKLNQETSKVLIGYVQDYRDPNVVDYSKLTHVIFSFAHPKVDGGILLNGDSALKNLRAVVIKAKKYNTKVMLAVGGWYNIQGGESYKYFKTAISIPASRTKLSNELAGIADREKLDGIDIDFEYPRTTVDAQNLTAFTKQLSGMLHSKGKELSMAVYSKINAATGTEMAAVKYEPSMFQLVDHVNIMAYDGQWDGKYDAANLSPYPFAEKIVNYWSHLFETHNLPKDKLVLGVPLYAQPENQAIKQASYGAIINQNPANAESDTVTMNGTIYHYNGEATMRKKTKLALDNGFGGMMMWEAGQDAKGSNSITETIAAALKDSASQYAVKAAK